MYYGHYQIYIKEQFLLIWTPQVPPFNLSVIYIRYYLFGCLPHHFFIYFFLEYCKANIRIYHFMYKYLGVHNNNVDDVLLSLCYSWEEKVTVKATAQVPLNSCPCPPCALGGPSHQFSLWNFHLNSWLWHPLTLSCQGCIILFSSFLLFSPWPVFFWYSHNLKRKYKYTLWNSDYSDTCIALFLLNGNENTK